MTQTLDFMKKINDLQKTKRYGNYPNFTETTSEHTFKVILMVDYFYHEFNLDLDYQKCIQLAIYHDFGELDLSKDIDIKENSNKDISLQKDLYESAKIKELASNYNPLIEKYYNEYKSKETAEARFVNACDKLEGMIHPQTIGEPIMNHELFATYADKAVSKFPLFLPFYQEIKQELHTLYTKWHYEWKEEYDSIFKTQ